MNKKQLFLMLTCLLVLAVAACGTVASDTTQATTSSIFYNKTNERNVEGFSVIVDTEYGCEYIYKIINGDELVITPRMQDGVPYCNQSLIK